MAAALVREMFSMPPQPMQRTALRRSIPGSAHVSCAGERVLAIENFSLDSSTGRQLALSKDCFGATPKPARETRPLPRRAPEAHVANQSSPLMPAEAKDTEQTARDSRWLRYPSQLDIVDDRLEIVAL